MKLLAKAYGNTSALDPCSFVRGRVRYSMDNLDNFDDLIKDSEFVGGIYDMDYETCDVHTTDYIKKYYCGGLQKHAFLVARMEEEDSEVDYIQDDTKDDGNMLRPHVLLLRVIGPASIPSKEQITGARYQNIEEKVIDEIEDDRESYDLDAISKGKLQKTAVEAEIIGTFYEMDDGQIAFGGDVHTVFPSGEYLVYKPTGEALEEIASFMNPRVRDKNPTTIEVGSIKYSASALRADEDEKGTILINADDLVGNKTAVFGMTRTGKSNSLKILATAVHTQRENVGQLIFDPSGEYANPNTQDSDKSDKKYALIEIDDGIKKVGQDEDADINLSPNLLMDENIDEALSQVRDHIWRRQSGDPSIYFENLVDADIQNPKQVDYKQYFDEDEEIDRGKIHAKRSKHLRNMSAFQAVLIKAGLEAHSDFTSTIPMNKDVREELFDTSEFEIQEKSKDDEKEIMYEGEHVGKVYVGDGKVWFHDSDALVDFWEAVSENEEDLNRANDEGDWIDDDLGYILAVLSPEGAEKGYDILTGVREHHDRQAKKPTKKAIYDRLKEGDTVIVDLSKGTEDVNKDRARRIVEYIVARSMRIFVQNDDPPHIQIYLEEAHRYFGSDRFQKGNSDPYVRLAKEGAKFHLGLVYATQEVSSVDDRVLANTSNWIVTHLNNQNEISELTNYYDFESFEDSIRRVNEKGFSRIRFLSNEYTLPVKIEKFNEKWVSSIQEGE